MKATKARTAKVENVTVEVPLMESYVWDAVADTPEQAANLRARSELMRQIAVIVKDSGWTQLDAAAAPGAARRGSAPAGQRFRDHAFCRVRVSYCKQLSNNGHAFDALQRETGFSTNDVESDCSEAACHVLTRTAITCPS